MVNAVSVWKLKEDKISGRRSQMLRSDHGSRGLTKASDGAEKAGGGCEEAIRRFMEDFQTAAKAKLKISA